MKIGYFRTETDLAYQDVIEGNLFAQVDRTVDLLCTKYSRAAISLRWHLPARNPANTRRGAAGSGVERGCTPGLHPFRADSDSGTRPPHCVVEPGLASPWTGRWTSSWAPTLPLPTTRPVANALFRAGMVEAWGRGIANIVSACRSAGMVKPQWIPEPGGLRLEFVFTPFDHGTPDRDRYHGTPSGDPAGARVADGSSPPATGPWATVEGRTFQRLGTEGHIGATEQSDPSPPC